MHLYDKMVVIAKNTSTPIKLDIYDKKLIYHLSQDLRMPQRKLAKSLRISPERVHYKVRRLLTEILSPAMNLDLVMLGFQNAVILVERLEQEAADALLENPALIMYFRILSRNQYLLIVSTADLDAFCKDHLADAHFTVHGITRFIPDDYNPYHLDLRPIPLPERGSIALRPSDYKLLAHLAENPLSTFSQIAERTGIDRNSVRLRIAALQQSGVILKFRYGINVFKMGMLVYFVKLQLSPSSKKSMIPYLRSDPYSGFIYETHDGLFMFYMPPDQRPLFAFTSRIAERDAAARVEILQAADYFKVEPLPANLIPVLRDRAAAVLSRNLA